MQVTNFTQGHNLAYNSHYHLLLVHDGQCMPKLCSQQGHVIYTSWKKSYYCYFKLNSSEYIEILSAVTSETIRAGIQLAETKRLASQPMLRNTLSMISVILRHQTGKESLL